jgi:hypothetical protein
MFHVRAATFALSILLTSSGSASLRRSHSAGSLGFINLAEKDGSHTVLLFYRQIDERQDLLAAPFLAPIPGGKIS